MNKEDLNSIIRLNDRIESKLRQKDELKSTMYNIGSIDYSKDRVQTSKVNSTEDLIIKIVDFEEEITRSIDRLIDLKQEASKVIDQIDGVYGTVLEMRYLECMRWEEIAYRLNYSIQHVYRLHGQALLKLKDESKC